MKKILIGLISFFLILVVALISIPFFVDVDRFRGPIEEEINSQLSGKIQIGKMNLSLMGGIFLKIKGLKLYSRNKKEILQVKDARLKIPLSSILGGTPRLKLVLHEPKINLVKIKSEPWNIAKLTFDNSKDNSKNNSKSSGESSKSDEIPELIKSSSISVEIENAEILVKQVFENKKKQEFTMKGIDFGIQNFSLSNAVGFYLNGDIKLADSGKKDIFFSGPLDLEGQFKLDFKNSKVNNLDFNIKGNLDDFEFKYPDVMKKSKGSTFNFFAKGNWNGENSYNVQNLQVELGDFKGNGVLQYLTYNQSYSLRGNLKSNEFSIASILGFFPQVKVSRAKGHAKIDLEIHKKQMNSNPNLKGSLKIKKLSGYFHDIGEEISLDTNISLNGEKIKIENLQSRYGKNQFTLSGHLLGLNKIKGKLMLGFNDLKFMSKKSDSSNTKTTQDSGSSSVQSENSSNSSWKKLVNEMRANKWVREMNLELVAHGKSIQFDQTILKNIKSKMSIRDFRIKLSQLSADLYGGNLVSTADLSLKRGPPGFAGNLSFKNINLKNLMETRFPKFKNTIEGVYSSKFSFGSKGYSSDEVTKQFVGNGKFTVLKGQLKMIDIAALIEGVLKKLPGRKKISKSAKKISQKFEKMNGKFAISEEKFILEKGEVIGGKEGGLDYHADGIIHFNTQLKMNLKAVDGNSQLVDKYPQLKQVAPGPGKAVEVPLKLSGNTSNIKTDTGYTVGILLKRYAKNQFKGKNKKKIEKVLGKILGDKEKGKKSNKHADKLKKGVKKLLEGFF